MLTFQPVAEVYGLTPARFDVLHVLHQRSGHGSQAMIRHVLGVSATTISRMVQALEKLGFIKRMKDLRDRRTKFVWLTEKGIAAVRDIVDGLIDTGHLDLAVEGCFDWPARQARRSVRILFKALRYFARKFADRATHMTFGQPPLAREAPWLEIDQVCEPDLRAGI